MRAGWFYSPLPMSLVLVVLPRGDPSFLNTNLASPGDTSQYNSFNVVLLSIGQARARYHIDHALQNK